MILVLTIIGADVQHGAGSVPGLDHLYQRLPVLVVAVRGEGEGVEVDAGVPHGIADPMPPGPYLSCAV